MSSIQILWLVTLIILEVLCINPLVYNACRTINKCKCTKESDKFALDCQANNSSLLIKLSNEQCELNCNDISQYSMYLPEIPPMGAAKYLAFINCPLPTKTTLTNVISRIASKDVEILTMTSGDLSDVSRKHFEGLKMLKKLQMSICKLEKLPEDLLYNMANLTILYLTQNAIEEIPERFFNQTRELRDIDLGGNRMQRIPSRLLVNLNKLVSLSFWSNNISYIESAMFEGLGNLTMLEMMNNRLTTLPPDAFNYLPNLRILSLRQNLLKLLPANLFQYNLKLEKVSLDGNSELNSLPDGLFSKLEVLKEISMSKCGIVQLPENLLSGSVKLETLNIAQNRLRSLPRFIFNDTHELQTLNLERNELTRIEDHTFGDKLTNLKELYLGYNSINITRNTFSGLSNLEKLYMKNNSLKLLPTGSFSNFKRIKILDLSNNELSLDYTDNFSPFAHLADMEKLDLQHNNITTIYFDWRATLAKLKSLDLSFNLISRVNFNDLSFIQDKIRVNLRNNLISTIDVYKMEALIKENLKLNKNMKAKELLVDLNNNPINCDCKLYDLLRYVDGSMDLEVRKELDLRVDGLVCTSPPEYKGVSIQNVNREKVLCTLDDGPKMPNECSQTYYKFRRHDQVIIMNCSNNKLADVPSINNAILSLGPSLKMKVDLRGNYLRKMPGPNMGYDNVIHLDVSQNMINEIKWIPPTIQVLKLDNNNFTYIDNAALDFINKTLLGNITFHRNPWKCDCDLLNFTKYLRENFKKIPFLHNITCGDEGNVEIITLIKSDLCPTATAVIVASSVLLAFMGLVVGVSAALYYRYNQEIKVWLYAHQMCLYCISEEELDKDKLFDAFISFSHKDEDFVVNELLPKLEEGPDPFKLCVHFRNWQPGEFITTNIARSVEESRRTVVVLSPSFLESEWGKMEFRTAHIKALGEGRARVIVIIYGDIGSTDKLDTELKAYLTTNTYVEWGDPWFWEKLRYALPHPPKYTKTNKSVIASEQKIQIFDDKLDLIMEPGTPPMATTPPADALHINPLLDKPVHNALNVALINGSLVNHVSARNNNNNHMYNNDVIC